MGLYPQTFSNFSQDAVTYIAAKTLMRIRRDVVVYGLSKNEKLPENNSKTFQYTRYEKLPLPRVAIAEGITPVANTMTLSRVQAVMDQWGDYVSLSDVAQITVKHPVVQQAIEVMAEQAAETIDRECIKTLMGSNSVFYPGVVSSRAGIGATDYLDSALTRKVVAKLRQGGAHYYEGRGFIGIIDPAVEMDLHQDTTFVTASSYSNIIALFNGEVGKWIGVRWVVTNLLPTIQLLSTPSKAATTGGTLTPSTTYYFKVTAVDNALGYEKSVTAEFTQATGVADTRINITMPSDTDYTYRVYAGDTTGVLYLSSEGNAAAAVVHVDAIATTGDAPPATPAASREIHYTWILGKEAFATPELFSLRTYITPDAASDSDPLAQRRKLGWKVMFKSVICNDAFLARIETVSRFS